MSTAVAAPPTDVQKPTTATENATDEAIAEVLESVAWLTNEAGTVTSLVIGDRDRIEGNPDRDIYGIRRKHLSASTHQNVSGCAARFALDSMLPQTINPLAANELGTGSHSIMERLYTMPAEKRTLTNLRRQVKPVTREQLKAFEGTPEYDSLFAEVSKTIGAWSEGIFTLEDPTQVQVYMNEMSMKGVTLSNGVPATGFIDRIRYEGDPSRLDSGDLEGISLHIDDYKFGKKVKRPSPMFGDHYGDQMRIYSDGIFQKLGVRPESARLLWPRQGKTVTADLSTAAVKTTLASFRRSWDLMNLVSDNATFPAAPSALCGWCPAANSCPVAQVKSENARNNAATLPGGSAPGAPVALPIPTVRQFAAPAKTAPASAHELKKENIMTTDFVAAAVSGQPLEFPTSSAKWGVIGAAGLVDAATTHLSIYGQEFNRHTAPAFVALLGGMVEQITRTVFSGGFDFTFESASRSIGAVKETLRNCPAPFGADQAAWEKWRKTVIMQATVKLRLAMALVETSEFGEPDYSSLLEHTVLPLHTRNPDAAALIAEAVTPEPALV